MNALALSALGTALNCRVSGMLARLSTRELYPQPLVLFFWDKISWSYSSWPRIHLAQTLNPWACLRLPSSWDYRTTLSGLSPVFKIFLWCWELNMPCKCTITELHGLFLFQHLFCVCVNMHVPWCECTVESGQPMWCLLRQLTKASYFKRENKNLRFLQL